MMEWKEYMQLWGPAVPMFAVFIFYLHRLVFRTVPGGFVRLRKALESLEENQDSHFEKQDEILHSIATKVDTPRRPPRIRKKLPPKGRGK